MFLQLHVHLLLVSYMLKLSEATLMVTFFNEFVQTHLLPILQPYNGSNPHSVVIMDNCSIHHVQEVYSQVHNICWSVSTFPATLFT